mgnify:CR=1 FL=1|jgi:antirestriction protein ArdC
MKAMNMQVKEIALPLAVNAATSEPYQGQNQAILLKAFMTGRFKKNEWVTLAEAQKLGAFIGDREGVALFKGVSQGEQEATCLPCYRRFTVFNIEQCRFAA